MAVALPGTRGLFSVLQHALSCGDRRRIQITRHIQAIAADFLQLVNSVAERPTRLYKLVPTTPSYIGACDACQRGRGGIWLDATDAAASPIVWREEYPPAVSSVLVTAANPSGTISISDLELTGMIAHKDVLVHAHDVRERTIWLAGENRAAIAWSQHGSSTSVAARAFLLQHNALHQRQYCYLARHHYLLGPVNAMADAASRRWDLSDSELVSRFNVHFPQATSWQLHRLPRDTNIALIGALCRRQPRNGYPANVTPLPTPAGASGLASVPASTLMPSTSQPNAPYPCYNSLHSIIAPDLSHPAATLSALTVEDAVRAVGQMYARLGSPDPRLNVHGAVDIRLTSFYRAWQRHDEPPHRVKPLPLSVVASVVAATTLEGTPLALACAECLLMGYFFLLRPGEYLGQPPRDRPGPLFRLRDIQFWVGSRALTTLSCPLDNLYAATFVTLTFTEQKNGVRNETIGHGRSGHPSLCPVLGLASRVLTLRIAGASADTPLNAFWYPSAAHFRFTLSSHLTNRC